MWIYLQPNDNQGSSQILLCWKASSEVQMTRRRNLASFLAGVSRMNPHAQREAQFWHDQEQELKEEFTRELAASIQIIFLSLTH